MVQSAGHFDELSFPSFSVTEGTQLFRIWSILNSQAGVLLRYMFSTSVWFSVTFMYKPACCHLEEQFCMDCILKSVFLSHSRHRFKKNKNTQVMFPPNCTMGNRVGLNRWHLLGMSVISERYIWPSNLIYFLHKFFHIYFYSWWHGIFTFKIIKIQ